ncbi:MAG: VWA domain-containing protein [Candidatus Hadarchaeales archaeon]
MSEGGPTVREVGEDLRLIRSALAGRIAPFLSSLLFRPRIVLTEAVETAGVTDRTMYINPRFWKELNFVEKTYVASHEVLHMALLHLQRERAEVPDWEENPDKHRLWNYAADAVVFRFLQGLISCRTLESKAVSPVTVSKLTGEPVGRIEQMSAEDIYRLLLKHVKKVEIQVDLLCGERGGEVVQEGDSSLAGASVEEARELWKSFLSRAYSLQRLAGTVPAGLERAVREILRPRINPKSLIKQMVREGLDSTVVSDWKRPSRRYEGLPGIKRFTLPAIWCLIDASGSISERDLRLELGTVYEFARITTVHCVSFDTEAYEFVTGRNAREVVTKVAKKIKGGGGTKIEKALTETLKRMKPKDVVLLLTDGEIFDIDEERVISLLNEVASRASVAAFCLVSDKELQVPGWRSIQLWR